MAYLNDLSHFYDLLDQLKAKLGGFRQLSCCSGRMDWPKRGVYFFFEPGEYRSGSGDGLRVVRVGTHALTTTSKTTLWNRLHQHQGNQKDGGGNHRGSIFRLHVGSALLAQGGWPVEMAGTWGKGASASKAICQAEAPLERAVSQYIGQMPFLWLAVEDAPGPASLRKVIEKNAIALLSCQACSKPADAPSSTWLGRKADREVVRQSGLWNLNHVFENYDPSFLDVFDRLLA